MNGRSGGFAKVQMSLLFCLVLRHESVSLRPHNSGSKSPPGLFQPDIVITGQHSNVLQDWNADNMTDKEKKKARSSVLVRRGYSLVYRYLPEGEMIHDKMTDLSIKPGNSQQIKCELTDYTQTNGRMYDPSSLSLISSFLQLWSRLSFFLFFIFQTFGYFHSEESTCHQFKKAITFRTVWFWYRCSRPCSDSNDGECTRHE